MGSFYTFALYLHFTYDNFEVLCPIISPVIQLYQSERTTLDHQHSRFRTIERQDSFDLSCEPVIRCGRGGSVRVVRPQPRTQSLDLSHHALESDLSSSLERNSHLAFSTPSDIFRSCTSMTQTSADSPFEPKTEEEEAAKLTNGSRSIRFKEERVTGGNTDAPVEPTGDIARTEVENNDASAAGPKGSNPFLEVSSEMKLESSDQGSSSSGPVSEGDSGIDPNVDGGEEAGCPGAVEETSAAEGRGSDSSPRAKAQGKKKGKVFSWPTVSLCCHCFLKSFSWMLFCCQVNAISILDQQTFTWMI